VHQDRARGLFIFPVIAGLLSACSSLPDGMRSMGAGGVLLPLGPGENPPAVAHQWNERDEILSALDRSIAWTKRKHAEQFFPVAGITHERALASLERFREVLVNSGNAEIFQQRIAREFVFFKSAGLDGEGGGVLFTAYCTPTLPGSLTPNETYRHPLYGLPEDVVKNRDGSIRGWQTQVGLVPGYPSRRVIEKHAILAGRGLELVWLADPLDAYIAHVNGSAFVELPDGSMFRLGYAGKNGGRYSSLGRALEDDGQIPRGTASLKAIRDWGARVGDEVLDEYLNRNESYVFFTPIESNPHGSLDFPVASGRSVATDKSIFPRGAIVYVEAEVPPDAESAPRPFERFLFDQDTGGAIRNPGRCDIYLGIGDDAEAAAGRVRNEGQMYYLFLR